MLFPNISNYSESKLYFSDFYELNKKAGVPISFRLLAKKLNWPFSYLSDVIHARKPLSVIRALEFAKFANLDVVETERMVYMTFTNFSNEDIQQYFLTKLEKEHNSDLDERSENHHAGLENEIDTCIEELKGDLSASALLKLLDLCQGKIRKELIGSLLSSFDELKDSKIVDEKIRLLEKNGNIRIISNHKALIQVEILRSSIYFSIDYDTRHLLANFTDHNSKLIRGQNCSGHFNNGFIKIKKENFKTILQKMSQLRNWLVELDKESKLTTPIETADCILFQYGINLATLINLESIGISSLKEWVEGMNEKDALKK